MLDNVGGPPSATTPVSAAPWPGIRPASEPGILGHGQPRLGLDKLSDPQRQSVVPVPSGGYPTLRRDTAGASLGTVRARIPGALASLRALCKPAADRALREFRRGANVRAQNKRIRPIDPTGTSVPLPFLTRMGSRVQSHATHPRAETQGKCDRTVS